jgi:hypothetical protein
VRSVSRISTVEAPELTVERPGKGSSDTSEPSGVVFKFFGEQTTGQVSVVEHPFPVWR